MAAPSAECERALPLIAARQDGELDGDSGELDWLDAHLGGCERCALAEEQMGDAAAIYRGEAPAVAPTPASAAAGQVAAAGRAPAGTVSAAASPVTGGRFRIRRPDGRRTVLAGGRRP